VTNGELGGFDVRHDRINRSVRNRVRYLKGLEILQHYKLVIIGDLDDQVNKKAILKELTLRKFWI
jgi:hypothetical protein